MSLVPPHARGQSIGLLGGSFNPAHAAHRAMSLLALKRLKLDAVWWLVTPGNPLKDARQLAPLSERSAGARHVADHPRIFVTELETAIGTRYSIDTITWLQAHCRGVGFVWLMGADNLRMFHRWKNWRDIAKRLPIAVVDRGALAFNPLAGSFAQRFARSRLPEAAAPRLAGTRPPAWIYLRGLRSPLSSTAIRQKLRQKKARLPLKLS